MDSTLVITLGVLLGCFLALSWFAGTDAPYVPTKMDQIRDILKLAGVKMGKKFYELGSGDGRVVLEAAKLGADSFGIEQSLLRVLYSKYQAKKHKLLHVHFIHGDIFSHNFSSANLIYIYLLSKGVSKLERKLRQELKPGARVITQTYHFKNWKPYRKIGNFWLYKV